MISEPVRFSADSWQSRPGYSGLSQLRRRKRNPRTTRAYSEKERLWLRFNEEGDGTSSYDPLLVTDDKFDLFAGWLLGDAEHGIKGESTNKDLNVFRSALNRFFAKEGLGRPLGTIGDSNVEVNQTIKHYRSLQILSKAMRGEDSDLHRVPCPESCFLYLLRRGEASTDSVELTWIGTFFVQLLGWLRGNSVGGFIEGDVQFDLEGALNIAVRRMKMRPHFLVQPGLIHIPAPSGDPEHPRARVFRVLRRCFLANRRFYLVVAETAKPNVETGEDASAALLTKHLRVMCCDLIATLPAGVMVASHSWREMAATACHMAHYDSLRMSAHGFWQNVGTMFVAYIEPFRAIFPISPFLARLFDFLRAV